MFEDGRGSRSKGSKKFLESWKRMRSSRVTLVAPCCAAPLFVMASRDARASSLAALAALLTITAMTPASSLAEQVRPLDAIFVIDNSGSMRSNDSGFATRQVVVDFASNLQSDSRLGIVLFDQRAELIEPLSGDVGRGSADRWAEKLHRVDYSGQFTDSPAGIERAIYELKNRGRADAEKVIIFITDGIVDTGDRQRDADKKRWLTESLASEGRKASIKIFGVAFTDAADVELIQALALKTEGKYFRVNRASDIGVVTHTIGQIVSEAAFLSLASAREEERLRTAAEVGEIAAASLREATASGAASGRVARFAQPTASVSSAPRGGSTRLILLSLGAMALLLLVGPPVIGRWKRTRGIEWPAALESSPRVAPRPRLDQATAQLVDVAKASSNGLLPYAIDRQRTRIGRDSSNDVVILQDTVSSFHATIDYKNGYFYVEEHRSMNGTFLNGQRLRNSRPVQLKSGDRIDFAVFEFRFIIPDHEPRGKTAVLDFSSVPVGAIRAEPEALSGSSMADPEPTGALAAFGHCIREHLSRISDLSEAHSGFVRENFGAELMHALDRKAEELIGLCDEDARGQVADLSRGGIHFTLCVVPYEIEESADWFSSEYGGYAKFLVNLLDTWASEGRICSALCVITFGLRDSPWISITILPATEDAESVEVMSFEFLSEDERRQALSLEIVEVGK